MLRRISALLNNITNVGSQEVFMQDQFDLYSDKVMQYFTHPKNMGKIANPDAVATVGNPKCGDVMKVFLKIGKRKANSNKRIVTSDRQGKKTIRSSPASPAGGQFASRNTEEYIEDIKVQTLGCGAAIATSSIATEMVKGKTLKEALKISNQEVTRKLGGLPKIKYHCSLLAEQGIKKAIQNYLIKKK